VDHLFQVMQQLKADGKTVIFITHKLRETLAFSDRVTVLRQGRNVGTLVTRETSASELAEMMVGRQVALGVQRPPSRVGEPVLRLEGVCLQEGPGRALLQDIHLEVREGEIVGIAGVDGNGQLELEEVICGLRRPTAGRVLINGQELGRADARRRRGDPRRFRALRGAHIPSDRLRRGLVPSMPLTRNAILGHHWRSPYARRGLLHTRAIEDHTAALIQRFQIRTGSMHQPAGSLSGGNQQKLVVGRELAHDPQLIIAAQPTRGVDVGAIEQIHGELLQMRAQGKAILLISTELDELLALSDRLAVIYEGRIVAQGPTESFTETQLGLWMAGQGDAAAEGVISLYDLDASQTVAEWGRWILRRHSLAAVESAALVYRCAFEQLNLKEVYCRSVASNTQVVAFHDSCGCADRRVLPAHFMLDGQAFDAVEHRVDLDNWNGAVKPYLGRLSERIAARLNHDRS